MRCIECGSVEMIEMHHVVPKSVGGTATVPLCVICHGKVHDRNFVKHRELQRKGIERAKKAGKYKGGNRKPTPIDKWVMKPKIQRVCSLIVKNKYSFREMASLSLSSVSTVQRVSNIYNSDLRNLVVKSAEHYYLNKQLTSDLENRAFIEVEKKKKKMRKLGIEITSEQERELFLKTINILENEIQSK